MTKRSKYNFTAESLEATTTATITATTTQPSQQPPHNHHSNHHTTISYRLRLLMSHQYCSHHSSLCIIMNMYVRKIVCVHYAYILIFKCPLTNNVLIVDVLVFAGRARQCSQVRTISVACK